LVAVLTIVSLAVVFYIIFNDKDSSDQKIGDGVKLTQAEAHGQALFGETCVLCHTLAASHASGSIGPNLDQVRPNRALVLLAIERGFTSPTGVMPAGLYSGADAEDIAAYVARAAGVGAPSARPEGTASATGGGASTTEAAPSSSTQAAPAGGGGEGDAVAGRSAFSSNCASCHTLRDAGATGTVGPDLDNLRPDFATVQRQVTNGGGGMPAFGSSLSRADIDNIAAYVSQAAGR